MWYTIQTSNHPEAGRRVPTQAAAQSWKTLYDGPIASADEARSAVEKLSAMYKHVRAFRGKMLGKMWYAVLRTH